MNNRIDFIYLNEQDMIKAGVLNMKKCISTMEDMFKLIYIGDYRMGGNAANEHGIMVTFPEKSEIDGMPLKEPDYRFVAMPAYLGGRFHVCGIKTYGSHHANKNLNLPRSILMMSLLDVNTGIPLAYMSANALSAIRTASVTGVGLKYLSNKNPKVLGIIGPGVMSKYALDAVMETQPSISTLKIKGRSINSLDNFIEHVNKKYPQITNIYPVESIEEACKDSDIIYYGTTNAKKFEDNPNIERDWIKDGALVISASSLLISTDFLSDTNVKLIADNYKMYEAWGHGQPYPTQKTVSTLLGMGYYDAVCDGKIKKKNITDIGGVLLGKETGRDNEKQILIYAVGGMPVEDVAWAYDCYQNALEEGIGNNLNLWEESEIMKY